MFLMNKNEKPALRLPKGVIQFDSDIGKRIGASALIGTGYFWSDGDALTFADFIPHYRNLEPLREFIQAMQCSQIQLIFPEPDTLLQQILTPFEPEIVLSVSDLNEDIVLWCI